MRRDPRAYLWDVRQAADAVLDIVARIDLKTYTETEIIHSAVERKFQCRARSPSLRTLEFRGCSTCADNWVNGCISGRLTDGRSRQAGPP